MPDTSLEYRSKFLKRQLQYDRKFRKIFNKIADDFARLSNDPNAKFTKSFRFNGVMNKKIDIIIRDFQKEALNLTESEIEKSWGLSNEKNDLIVKDYLKTIGKIKAVQKASFFLPNIPALKAFISGKHGTETLSESIWEVAAQLRNELKIHLGIGILNGDSANTISQRIRQYLKNPDALFRRVRDAKGRLIASKAMLENAPGQGVYNSAFKNAMRVARTNTNQAYLLADHERWLKLPMVIGVKISLSAQHPEYNYPEICEELEGTYPKDFVWVGWHPQCLCHAVAVLMPKEDFDKYLTGTGPLQAKQITEYPDKFKQYVKDNYERYGNYRTPPYWIQDNQKVINGIMQGQPIVGKTGGTLSQLKYVEAKTIQEAEKYAKQYSKDVDFKGLDLNGLNQINARYSELTKQYKPDIKLDYFGNYGTFMAKNNLHRRQKLAMGYSGKFNSLIMNPKSTKIGAYAEQDAYYAKTHSMQSTRSMLKQMNAPIEVRELADLKNIRNQVAGRDPVDSFTHEIGHRIQFGLSDNSKSELLNILIEEKAKGYSYLISDYAFTNYGEFFAESFAAYNNPLQRQFVSPKIIKFIEKNLLK